MDEHLINTVGVRKMCAENEEAENRNKMSSISADNIRLREEIDSVLWEFTGPDGFMKSLSDRQRMALEHLKYLYEMNKITWVACGKQVGE